MYLKAVTLENIRSHTQLELEFEPGSYAGWHVILGDNGAGKSTLMRAIALGLTGPAESAALRQDWRDWLNMGASHGAIRLTIAPDARFDESTDDELQIAETRLDVVNYSSHGSSHGPPHGTDVMLSAVANGGPAPLPLVWGRNRGWFSASYGPFRRFTGGNKEYEKLFHSNPKLAPHLSVFGEDVALTEALAWLQYLRVRELEGLLDPGVLANLMRLVNDSGLLPHDTRLTKVSATAITFTDGAGCQLPVEQLSDGYRSILSLTFELLRQFAHAYGEDKVWAELQKPKITLELPGVVMIDEIDAHLHPTWQRRIGLWFCEQFPKIQFIVTTHSPLVCQAATSGTIWLLAKPGESGARKIDGALRDRVVYGSVLDALDTDLFGEDVARSDAAKQMLVRLAELNVRSLRGQLSAEEREEMERLRRTFPTDANAGVDQG